MMQSSVEACTSVEVYHFWTGLAAPTVICRLGWMSVLERWQVKNLFSILFGFGALGI
jgi:hypothetical protein